MLLIDLKYAKYMFFMSGGWGTAQQDNATRQLASVHQETNFAMKPIINPDLR